MRGGFAAAAGGQVRRHGAGWKHDAVSPVEDFMFRTKSRTQELTEQFQDQSESLADTAATVTEQLRERVGPAVGQATENARDWARPHYEHGVEMAAPKLESAVNNLAPRVDTARDKIVEELIPRLAEAISAWAAATVAVRDEAVSRGQGAASVMSGDSVATPRRGRKRRVLLIVGLLGGAAAAALAVMKNSAPKDDPWTTPLADRHEAAPNGRHSSTTAARDAGDAVAGTSTATKSEVVDEPNGQNRVDLARDIDLTGQDLTDQELKFKGPRDKDPKDLKDAELPATGDGKNTSTDKNGSDQNPRP
jgi:hypothetical protein